MFLTFYSVELLESVLIDLKVADIVVGGLFKCTQSSIKCWNAGTAFEPSKGLVSQSLSSGRTREREMAHKALGPLLTAQSAFERERDRLTRLLQ